MEVREPSAKYLVRRGYKQTEAGMIPEDWEVAALDSLGKRGRPAIKAGPFGSSLTKNTYVAEGYKVYGQEQVIRGDYLYGDYYISKARFYELRSCAVEPGDILLSLVGTAGRVLVIPPDAPEGIINPRLIRFSFDKNVISPPYFRFLFETKSYQALLARSAQGGTMGVLNAGILRPICIPLPQLPEQDAIAEALGDVDALIESLEQLLTKKRHLKQGAMQELLTGKKRLPGFSGEWEMKPLGEIAHIKTGARNNQDKIEEGEYPFFVRSATVERINSYSYDCEAILVPGEGGIGSIFHYIQGRFDVHQRVYAITQFSLETSGKFIYFYIAEKFGVHAMQNSVKATVDSLRLPTFRNFEIVMPPTANEQTAIAAILSDMDAEIAALEAKLAKARSLKQGMMQELLTGRIRLV